MVASRQNAPALHQHDFIETAQIRRSMGDQNQCSFRGGLP
jgi:hypothetical protein